MRTRRSTETQIIGMIKEQAHMVHGAMSGALGKKLGLVVTSAKEGDGARVYRISPGWPDPAPVWSVQKPVMNLGRLARGAVDRDHVLRAG